MDGGHRPQFEPVERTRVNDAGAGSLTKLVAMGPFDPVQPWSVARTVVTIRVVGVVMSGRRKLQRDTIATMPVRPKALQRTIQAAVVPPASGRPKQPPPLPSRLATQAVAAIPSEIEEDSDPTSPVDVDGDGLVTEPRTIRPALTMVSNQEAELDPRARAGNTVAVDALDEVEIDLEESAHAVPRPFSNTDRFSQPLSVTRTPSTNWWPYAASALVVVGLIVAVVGLGG